jgi:hypothetical protein
MDEAIKRLEAGEGDSNQHRVPERDAENGS